MKISIYKKNFIRKKTLATSGLKAFSLIELSVAIVIISIMVSGLLSLATNSANNDKAKKTQDNIEKIYQAMGVYLLEKRSLSLGDSYALPCPAAITSKKSSDASYGLAAGTTGVCADGSGVYNFNNLVYGMVPVRDLNLPSDIAEDGYGNKFGYLIQKEFTGDNFGVTSSNGVGIDVIRKNTSMLNPAKLAMFAIISYGPNKSGAFNANSNSQNPLSTDAAEKDNHPTVNQTLDTAVFYNDGLTYTTKVVLRASASDATTVFDDVIFFKTRDEMVKDFNALYTINCPAVSADTTINYDGSTPTDWPIGHYNEVVLSTTDCPTGWQATVAQPGRRCDAYGSWETPSTPAAADIAIPCTQ